MNIIGCGNKVFMPRMLPPLLHALLSGDSLSGHRGVTAFRRGPIT
jgi:hypothetical protein